MEDTSVVDQKQTDAQKRRQWLMDAYTMLDWLSENEDFIPMRDSISLFRHYWDWDYYQMSEDSKERVELMLADMRNDAAVLRHYAPVGSVQKIDSDYSYGVYRVFGEHRLYLSTVKSATCVMVPTEETKEVVSYDIPDEVREQYKVVKSEPVMKQVCPPITNREL